VLTQKNNASGWKRWIPNLRFTLQEIIPTGRYNNLDPTNLGTDGTGYGSYQTAFALNFQYLYFFWDKYYLSTRLSLNHVYAQSTQLTGLSSYGGSLETRGRIDPGNLNSIDLAGELSVTQNWSLVMEGLYLTRQASRFQGFPGLDAQGLPLGIGYHPIVELSVAPAIEYNFSEHYGIIGGVWFSVRGKDSPDFQSVVVALNIYF
jgi:hypothetical protein